MVHLLSRLETEGNIIVGQAKKKLMRRKVAQAIGHQMKSIECMLIVSDFFAEPHPEWIPFFTAICNNCIMTIQFIKSLAIKAWGYFPDDLDKWLK
jgi:hypothetical protein